MEFDDIKIDRIFGKTSKELSTGSIRLDRLIPLTKGSIHSILHTNISISAHALGMNISKNNKTLVIDVTGSYTTNFPQEKNILRCTLIKDIFKVIEEHKNEYSCIVVFGTDCLSLGSDFLGDGSEVKKVLFSSLLNEFNTRREESDACILFFSEGKKDLMHNINIKSFIDGISHYVSGHHVVSIRRIHRDSKLIFKARHFNIIEKDNNKHQVELVIDSESLVFNKTLYFFLIFEKEKLFIRFNPSYSNKELFTRVQYRGLFSLYDKDEDKEINYGDNISGKKLSTLMEDEAVLNRLLIQIK